MFDPESLARYPDQPGVYLMKDRNGQVLYVGKAKHLRTRLKQYFAKHRDSREMVPYLTVQIASIDTVVTLTEKEALLLENQLIKQHKPKYNVLLKDDKSFISLLLTDHQWPMLRLVRYKGKPKDKGTYFGPYTNALAARQTFDLIARLFPLRQCSDLELASRSRPCLLYDIKRCIAPCVGKCTAEEYQTHVDGVRQFLRGKDKEVLGELEAKMEKAMEELEFERAKELHRTIEQLKSVLSVQHVEDPSTKDCDVFGLHREADAVLIAKLLFREGKLIGSEHFSFHSIASNEAELWESFLVQHYLKKANSPKELLLPSPLENRAAIEELLFLKIFTPQKGKKRELLEMGRRNAEALFVREQDARSLKEKLLLDLQETLQLTRFPRRIECFDTSNLQGTDPVASLVSFLDGEKDKGRFRLFKIKKTEVADDYTAMREVIYRHLKRAKEKQELPDLLIVDGGKGQLKIAQDLLIEFDIASIDLIAVTKEAARHDKGLTQEKIYLLHQREPLLIEERSPLLFLLQKIRDEAHSQAIHYHRLRRAKRTLSSELDTIEGIGPKKKTALLKHFGSVKAIKQATPEELKAVSGITERDVKTLSLWIGQSK